MMRHVNVHRQQDFSPAELSIGRVVRLAKLIVLLLILALQLEFQVAPRPAEFALPHMSENDLIAASRKELEQEAAP